MNRKTVIVELTLIIASEILAFEAKADAVSNSSILEERESIVEEFLSTHVAPRMWQERYDVVTKKVEANSEKYAPLVDIKVRLPQSDQALQNTATQEVIRLGRAIRLAVLLGPNHGQPILNEFESITRTTIQDYKWLASQVEDMKEQRRLQSQLQTLQYLHNSAIEALTEIEDHSLIPYIMRTLPRGEDEQALQVVMEQYLLQAARTSPRVRQQLNNLLNTRPEVLTSNGKSRARSILTEGEDN